MTVAASKYTNTLPSDVLKSCGNTSGNNMAKTLNSHAIPEPIPISVNIFRFIVLIEVQARLKNIEVA